MSEANILEAGYLTGAAAPARPTSFWKRMTQVLRAFFGRETSLADFRFSRAEIGALHQASKHADDAVIDDQTWKDLDLDTYSEKISQSVSIFGQQVLHLRLRKGLSDADAKTSREKYQAQMHCHEDWTMLNKTLTPLRKLDVEVSGLVFGEIAQKTPWWVKGLWIFRIVGLLSIGGAVVSTSWLIVLCIVILIFFATQISWYVEIERFDRELASLRVMLRVAHELGTLAKHERNPALRDFDAALDEISKASRGVTRSLFETSIPGMLMYMDWFMLSNIGHHFRSIETLVKKQKFFQHCYLLIGNLEADLAVARHLLTQKEISWAERGGHDALSLTDVVNPLLTDASPLSITLQGKGAFLSGQNGAGKSTFLRTLGINLVVGRSLGFCYAAQASIPTVPVYTSIQIEDSMSGGESLYIAELRRARELIESSLRPHKGVYIVDEIFRGTNHVESVSAAAAVMHALSQHALVIVSSHNLVLSALLARWFESLCVESTSGESAGLAVVAGVLDKPNGIALLSSTGFSSDISRNANNVAAWLSGYLAHPKECPDILKP